MNTQEIFSEAYRPLDGILPPEKAVPQDIYVGNGILNNIPRYIRKKNLGRHCVLVADMNTYEIAGKRVAEILRGDGIVVVECVVRRPELVEPDETAVGEVLLSLQPDTEFLISVGSGVVTDITRVNAKRAGLPMVCVGTAASMDGYTSVVCPLVLRGVKIHRPGNCPEIIVCDIDILKTAPLEMVQCGVGDVLGKYIAKADWILGNIINDEPYSEICGKIVTDAVNRLVDNIDAIRDRTDEGMRILIEALLLAGLTTALVGYTRAVASIEHNIEHYWDMGSLARGVRPPRHGAAVGVATLLVWNKFKRFAEEDLSKLDIERVRAQRLTREQREAWMRAVYGEEGGNTIMEENPEDFLTWEEQLRRIHRAQERFAEIKACIDDMPSYEKVYDAMKRLGAPMTAEECGVGEELLNLSMRCAKDYRSRYTLFKLIDECGLSDEYLSEYPIDFEKVIAKHWL